MHLSTQSREKVAAAVPNDVAGLIAGTIVLTLDGEKPVESLREGDRIITRDTGMAVLKAVTVTEAEFATVRIKAGSLGHKRPDSDMHATPGALVHLRDWRAMALFGTTQALVPAHRLVDGEFVSSEPVATHKVYDLTFDAQHILYANWIEIASAAH